MSIPPPSTDITIGARITGTDPRLPYHLFPPEAEVKRLWTNDYSSPSPPIPLSPPLQGKRLARCTAPLAPFNHPLHQQSGCPTQIQTLRISSTQALIDAVTCTALPSTPLPPTTSISLNHHHCCPYEIGESSTARPTRGRGIDYGFVSTVDAEERRQGIRDVGSVFKASRYRLAAGHLPLLGIGLTLQETVWMVEEEAYASREAWAHSIGLSQATHQELQTHHDHVYAHETYLQAHQTQLQLQRTLIQTQHQDQMVETLRVIRDMRREMSDMQAELLALREQQRRARQPGPEARIPDHQDASGDVRLPTFVANETEKVDKYISGLPDNIYGNVKSARPKTLDETIELANDLMDQKLRTYAERQSDNKRKADDSSRNNHGHQQQPFKSRIVAKGLNMGDRRKEALWGIFAQVQQMPSPPQWPVHPKKGNGAAPKGNGCFECGAPGHFKRDCPKLKNKDGGNGNAQGWVYAVGNAEKRGNTSGNPDANVVTGTFLLNNHYASILFDTGADRSFISTAFSSLINIAPTSLENCYDVELADGKLVEIDTIIRVALKFLWTPVSS
ncbi:putative reverse transcriptase domain-containing protein [Tanacetum coccineum]